MSNTACKLPVQPPWFSSTLLLSRSPQPFCVSLSVLALAIRTSAAAAALRGAGGPQIEGGGGGGAEPPAGHPRGRHLRPPPGGGGLADGARARESKGIR
eukprot:704818-Prorocentrum_minimum.AAC.1